VYGEVNWLQKILVLATLMVLTASTGVFSISICNNMQMIYSREVVDTLPLKVNYMILPLNFSVWRYSSDVSFSSEVMWHLDANAYYNGSAVPLNIGIYHLNGQKFIAETEFTLQPFHNQSVHGATLNGGFENFSTDYAVAIENEGDRDILIHYNFTFDIFIKSYPYRIAGIGLVFLGVLITFLAFLPIEKLKDRLTNFLRAR